MLPDGDALVGDPDQCIYEFSMADATSLPVLKALISSKMSYRDIYIAKYSNSFVKYINIFTTIIFYFNKIIAYLDFFV